MSIGFSNTNLHLLPNYQTLWENVQKAITVDMKNMICRYKKYDLWYSDKNSTIDNIFLNL
ncbi:Protein CBG25258 [Caenorhabditis briggsae]|uniref:Protein CBG25258 n=1 Tax=Caenorhabditis briggsae TaxID=6238 RepID=B6IFM8_CAEBR|nr:Protein CBG25258 [Caenorhabditis briggsae]CAR98708.1 Protein CBG25258 [Caenorhabditis briggsae]